MAITKYTDREIPQISLANFDTRVDDITKEVISAAEDNGFFCVVDHEISPELVNRTFGDSVAFFSLDDSTKSRVPFSANHNAGWEQNSQKRPSTGEVDRKESYQIQFGENMQGRWIGDDVLPGFQQRSLEFMRAAQSVSEKLMICFARGLGFPANFFIACHDVSKEDSCYTTSRRQKPTMATFLTGLERTRTGTFSLFCFKSLGSPGSRFVLGEKCLLALVMAIHGPRLNQMQHPTPSFATSATCSCHGPMTASRAHSIGSKRLWSLETSMESDTASLTSIRHGRARRSRARKESILW